MMIDGDPEGQTFAVADVAAGPSRLKSQPNYRHAMIKLINPQGHSASSLAHVSGASSRDSADTCATPRLGGRNV
jgi:hypothetical protein